MCSFDVVDKLDKIILAEVNETEFVFQTTMTLVRACQFGTLLYFALYPHEWEKYDKTLFFKYSYLRSCDMNRKKRQSHVAELPFWI